jgi:hypothetical protein
LLGVRWGRKYPLVDILDAIDSEILGLSGGKWLIVRRIEVKFDIQISV